MEWFITLLLMSLIVTGGVMYSATESGLFNPDATEPFLSQQAVDCGIAFGLAAVIPFWRGHPILGYITASLAVLGIIQGLFGLWKHTRTANRQMTTVQSTPSECRTRFQ